MFLHLARIFDSIFFIALKARINKKAADFDPQKGEMDHRTSKGKSGRKSGRKVQCNTGFWVALILAITAGFRDFDTTEILSLLN